MVRIEGDEVLQKVVEGYTWQLVEVDLSPYAGKSIHVDLGNGLNDQWSFEAGYWSGLQVVSK